MWGWHDVMVGCVVARDKTISGVLCQYWQLLISVFITLRFLFCDLVQIISCMHTHFVGADSPLTYPPRDCPSQRWSTRQPSCVVILSCDGSATSGMQDESGSDGQTNPIYSTVLQVCIVYVVCTMYHAPSTPHLVLS